MCDDDMIIQDTCDLKPWDMIIMFHFCEIVPFIIIIKGKSFLFIFDYDNCF